MISVTVEFSNMPQAAASYPVITSGVIAPASTPSKIGDVYVNTSAKKLYFATGTTNSSDWTIAN